MGPSRNLASHLTVDLLRHTPDSISNGIQTNSFLIEAWTKYVQHGFLPGALMYGDMSNVITSEAEMTSFVIF